MSHDPNPYSPNPTHSAGHDPQALSKLKAPGVALIVIGSLGLLLLGAYFALTLVMVSNGAIPLEAPPEMTEPVERNAHYAGALGSIIIMGLNVLLQIVVILAGVAMVRGKGRGVALTGSILSLIPCFSSSLCIMGIPFGIWALVVLMDHNVKRVFK